MGKSVMSLSGMAIRGLPTKKCPGVRKDRSLGSSDIGDKGREFKTASIYVSTVAISSKSNTESPTVRLR